MMSPKDGTDFGDFSPELVPVIEPGALALALPPSVRAGSEIAADDLLSDALFGEVIDISDLIPRMLSPSAEAPGPQLPAAEMVGMVEFGMQDGGDLLALSGHSVAMTILYDDDVLVSDGTLL